MVGATCASCGAVNPIGAGYCLRCGRWLPGAPLAAPMPPPPPSGVSPSYPAGAYVPPPPGQFSAAHDGEGLRRIRLASLVSFLLGLITPALFWGVGPAYGFSAFGTAGSSGELSGAAFDFLVVATVVAAVVGLVTLGLTRAGFARLRPIDVRFESPTTLLPLAIIGLVLLAIGLPLLLGGLGPIIHCTNQMGNQTVPQPSNCLAGSGSELAAGALATLIGAVLGLIGYVALVLGLWRMGDRYGSSLLHAGAILTLFIPFVGWLLVFLGCREQQRRLSPWIGGSTGYSPGPN